MKEGEKESGKEQGFSQPLVAEPDTEAHKGKGAYVRGLMVMRGGAHAVVMMQVVRRRDGGLGECVLRGDTCSRMPAQSATPAQFLPLTRQ